MNKNWMFLWKLDQIERVLEAGKLNHAASDQFSRVSVGDRIWIVGTRKDGVGNHRLVSVGYVMVDQIVDQAEARHILGVEPWPASHHVIANTRSSVVPYEIQLDEIVSQLRFVSPTSKDRLITHDGIVNPQQLQTMRELTTESANILNGVWTSSAKRTSRDLRSRERLPAQVLRKVKADDLWFARQRLLDSRDYTPFDDSDEYDVLLENGQRLPPKALFGKALSKSLKSDVLPKHFTGGRSSTCFRILKEHGYEIVRKGSAPPEPPGSSGDAEWREGSKNIRTHLRSERQSGLAAAKREQFVAENGRLYCEVCGLVPSEAYDSKYAESCIEVHHARVAVADMQPGHLTKLKDLQCLCANCHRIEHRRLRVDSGS